MVVAFNEDSVFLLSSLEGIEFWGFPARFVLIQVFNNMVIEEVLKNIKFEIVFVVKFFALLGLQESIAFVLVAVLDYVLFKHLHSFRLESKDDPVFKLKFDSFRCFKGLLEVFNVENPRSRSVGDVVK